jgi:hypothetical protein
MMMSREMRRIHKTWHLVQGGREEDDKEGSRDEEEKEDADVRAVKEAIERPSWKECGHEGEEREQVVLSTANAKTRPEKGHAWTSTSPELH